MPLFRSTSRVQPTPLRFRLVFQTVNWSTRHSRDLKLLVDKLSFVVYIVQVVLSVSEVQECHHAGKFANDCKHCDRGIVLCPCLTACIFRIKYKGNECFSCFCYQHFDFLIEINLNYRSWTFLSMPTTAKNPESCILS